MCTAVGDLHGDAAATREALRLARVLHPSRDVWVGGNTVVVQVGDQLDRGDDELEVLSLLDRLSKQAAAAGGALEVLCGNHEIMAAQGQFRYATDGACAKFRRWARICRLAHRLPPPLANRLQCDLWKGRLGCGKDDNECRRRLSRLPGASEGVRSGVRSGSIFKSTVRVPTWV